jgi:hypothetical protein
VQGTVTFSSAYLTFLELYNPGSLTQGWTWATNATASQVIFAGSGTTPFSGSGVIVYLKFQLKPAFVAGTTAALQLPSILLNEGTPNPLVDVNGYILGSNTLVSPSVSVVGSANPVLSGVPVTFTATPVNGGVSPAYQWRVNSVNVSGATSSVYTYSPANNDQVSCVMTSSSLCVNPVQATSNVITMSVTGLPANLNVNGTVGNLQSTCYNATQTITVAGNNTTFLVNSGGSATFIAGQWIRFLPGTRVFSGGYLTGKIAPGGPWCNAKSAVALTGEKENAPLVTDQRQGLTLYPNPSTGLVTLKIPESVFTEDPIQLCVFGLQGNQLISQQLSADNPLRVDLTHLPAGIYFVQVRQGSLINKGKVIKTD